jgi:amidase
MSSANGWRGAHGDANSEASDSSLDIDDANAASTSGAADVVLNVAGLRAAYGQVPVLHGITFALHAGEAVGIVGHNGVGKTTFLKALIGLVPATAGRISIDGIDVTRMKAHDRSRLGIGYVPQGRGILPGLSALENLRLAWTADSGDTEAAAIERIVDTLPRLRALLDRKGGALSGGEQQILALGRALMPVPWLLLLDEPSEGIQPSIVQEIGEILANLRKRDKLSLVVVEQNLDLVLDVADRIVVMERGRIERDVDAHVVHAGGLAELLGMGAMRTSRAPVLSAARSSVPPSPSGSTRSPPANSAGRVTSPGASIQPSTTLSPSLRGAPVPVATYGHPSAPPARHAAADGSPRNLVPSPAVRPAAPPHPNQPAAAAPTSRGESMSMVKRPTLEQLKHIVGKLHMSMSDREVGEYLDVLEGTMQAYDRVDQLPDYLPEVRYPRTPGTRPSAAENPLGAWYVKSEVKGAPYGPLAGKRIVLKDNICLAGVPMMNGASSLEGYVPDVDATVATRILDAGGTIVGKAHCESFCLSGGSHTSQAGPVHNPYKIGYSAGGSSSGCAALVGAGEVEMAIGGDQGGSIRMPGSFSGCYGMKGTHGLVPYTGAMPIEATIDHLGPMTTTVADNALLLEVIAGSDGLDPRQYNVRVDKYTAALGRGVAGMRIGVLTEGFQHDSCEPDVVQKVRQAADRLRGLGAIVEEISIPMHRDGLAIWTPIALEGLQAQMMHGNGMGFNWEGLYTTSLLDAHANWRARANQLSRTLKISMMAGEYFIRQYRGHYYAKAQNLSRLLRKTYDEAFARHELLLMPTTPMKATPIPPQDAPLALYCQRAFEMLPNTAPFDVTGHPAMNVPCGLSAGLPVGMHLVGAHYNESTIYRAAHAFEQLGDWRNF